ncbi:flavodoxin [Arcobacter sp. CECT 8983]|uniref:flavodoxin n=1 Tax=Arcobacter sp. CECT 8983 TaxID=2044508 RepID=UPI00100A248E|nr:flavodoxin [Arcobacter sp. CECT 8983]RXJ90705.1 flavodoxin [Arcobacter sp. CECT 8983]
METIGLFYGSDTGTTEEVAEKIKSAFSKEVELHNIADSSKEDLEKYDKLILASATWGSGDLQADWEDFENNLQEIDFSSKTIALVGLGDQETYSDTFCNALANLYAYVKAGNVVGRTSADGYYFDESDSVENGEFVGLAIDDVNQDELTDERIEAWVKQIEGSF